MAELNRSFTRIVTTRRSAGFTRWPLSSAKCGFLLEIKHLESSKPINNNYKARVSQHNPWKAKRGKGGREGVWAHCLQEFFNVGRSSRFVWGRVKRVHRHRHPPKLKGSSNSGENKPKKQGFPPKKTARRPSPRLFISVTTLNYIPC